MQAPITAYKFEYFVFHLHEYSFETVGVTVSVIAANPKEDYSNYLNLKVFFTEEQKNISIKFQKPVLAFQKMFVHIVMPFIP